VTTFAEAVTESSSQKHLLFEVEPNEPLWNWTLTDGKTNTYERSWNHLAATDVVKGGLYRRLIGIEEDGTALGETDSIARVEANAGYYYHDEANQKIYLHTTGSVDPDTLDMVAGIFRLHFSTTGETFTFTAGAEGRSFDGASDCFTKAFALDDVTDSKKFIYSTWFRLHGGDGNDMFLLNGGDPSPVAFTIRRQNTTNKLLIFCTNSADSVILYVTSKSTYTASPAWHHLYLSADLDTLALNLYVDGADEKGLVTTLLDDTIDFTVVRWDIGSFNAGTSGLLNGGLSEIYFYPGEYLDAEGRFKFRDVNGEPVDLGDSGELVTGTSPACFFPDADATNNRGTGGDFTAL